MKVALGKFACRGIESSLGSDLLVGARAAIADYARRIESGTAPVGIPPFLLDSAEPVAATSLDVAVDERTWSAFSREAERQGTTPSRLAAHSVLVYLAELDRLDPPDGSAV